LLHTPKLISHSCEGPALSEAEWAGIHPFRHSESNEESVFHHPASKARFRQTPISLINIALGTEALFLYKGIFCAK
jgi:hypothetical protein